MSTHNILIIKHYVDTPLLSRAVIRPIVIRSKRDLQGTYMYCFRKCFNSFTAIGDNNRLFQTA